MPAALERGEFEPHYQPMYALADHAIVAVEALTRWRRRGTAAPLGPHEFITLAEQTGLIRPLGQAAASGLPPRRNLAQRRPPPAGQRQPLPLQLADHELLATIDEILAHTGLPATALRLEITESTAVDGPSQTLHELTDRGIQLAIDDFGPATPTTPRSRAYRSPPSNSPGNWSPACATPTTLPQPRSCTAPSSSATT
jgi:EAL domain-containing protein (putative c-di-GMP-specific phosphodiesterase class I)